MAKKKKITSAEQILDLFMDYTVEHGLGRSVYEFCTASDVSENDFYDHYDTMEMAERSVWQSLMRSSIQTLHNDESFASYQKRDQLLSFYYTFFENCLLNRAFLITSIEYHGSIKVIPILSQLKEEFEEFIINTFGGSNKLLDQLPIKVSKITDKAMSEAYWAQLLFLLDFWRKDTSEQCEKTDIAIEKAVKATMDIIDVTPIKSVFDFGKFIWQERFAK